MLNTRWMITALAVGLVGTACGGGDNGENGQNGGSGTLAISSFQASADSVRSGDTVTLNWNVTGATFVELEQNGTSIFTAEGDDAVGAGSQESNPVGNSTTFRLVAANDEGQVEETITVSVQGIRIVELSASPSTGIRSGDVVELSWVIEGANVESLELLDEEGNVPVGANDDPVDLLVGNTGTVEIKVLGDLGAEADTETFTLRAVGGGGEASESLELDVEVALPIINAFGTGAGTTSYTFGSEVTAVWNVRNATRVILRFDGTNCLDTQNFDTDVENRTSCGTISAATHTLEILVGNVNTPTEDDFVPASIELTGTAPPVVDSFSVDPPTYWQGATEITFTWETSIANTVEIQERIELGTQSRWCTITQTPEAGCRGFAVTAPNDVDGSFVFPISGTGSRTFRVRAILEADGEVVAADNETVTVESDFNEPASSFASPIVINSSNLGLNQRATITNPNEEDWFAVDVPENGRIVARAGVDEFDIAGGNASCLTGANALADTEIEMYDENENLLGSVSRNAFDAFGGTDTSCAVIAGHRHDFAVDLPAGRYYFKVTGQDGRIGEYTFAVDLYQPVPAPFTEMTCTSSDWEIAEDDVMVVAFPLENPAFANGLLWGYANHAIIANGMSAFFRHSAVIVSSEPHERRNYGNEIQPAMQALGFKINSGFVASDIASGIGANDPVFGLALMYTAVPLAGTSTGTTFDYRPLGTADGLHIPESLFPLATEVQSFGKSFGEDPVFDENVNPMNGNPIDPLAYPLFPNFDCTSVPDSPNPAPGCSAVVDGVSHRHFLHVNSVAFNDTPEIDSPADRYTWTVHVFDESGNGCELEVSFDIN